jgi:hypothetical protein
MRAYKVVVDKEVEPVEGAKRVDWAGTQADAKALRREMVEAHELKPLTKLVAIEEVDVPTDKQGLLAFLKANVKE